MVQGFRSASSCQRLFSWRSWGYRTIACTQTNTELSCLKMRFVLPSALTLHSYLVSLICFIFLNASPVSLCTDATVAMNYGLFMLRDRVAALLKKKKSKQTKSSGKSAEVRGRALKRRVILQWDGLKPMWSVLTFPPHPPPSLHPPLLLVVSPGRDKGWTGGLFWTVGAVQMFATHNHTCNRK